MGSVLVWPYVRKFKGSKVRVQNISRKESFKDEY